MDVHTASRRPRFRRHKHGQTPFVMTDRDREILRVVAGYRLISSSEIHALVGGSGQGVLRRLGLLFHAGYLDRPRQQRIAGNAKLIYALGHRGHALVVQQDLGARRRRGIVENNRTLGYPFIKHGLMVSRLHMALELACRQRSDIALDHWSQGAGTYDYVVVDADGRHHRLPVCPDAYFVLRLVNEQEGQNRVHAFVEADQSTMSVKRFTAKLHAYWHYWRSGRSVAKINAKNFLVVTVTKTPARMRDLLVASGTVDEPQHRGLRMFLFGCERDYTVELPEAVLKLMWRTPTDDHLHGLDE